MAKKDNIHQQIQAIICICPPPDVWDLARNYGADIRGTENFLAAQKILEEWNEQYNKYLCFIVNLFHKAKQGGAIC